MKKRTSQEWKHYKWFRVDTPRYFCIDHRLGFRATVWATKKLSTGFGFGFHFGRCLRLGLGLRFRLRFPSSCLSLWDRDGPRPSFQSQGFLGPQSTAESGRKQNTAKPCCDNNNTSRISLFNALLNFYTWEVRTTNSTCSQVTASWCLWTRPSKFFLALVPCINGAKEKPYCD